MKTRKLFLFSFLIFNCLLKVLPTIAETLKNNISSFTVPEFSSATKPLNVTIVYPAEGAKIPQVKNSFVYGNISRSSATLKINGIAVPVYHTGSFIEYIPFMSGEFKIEAEADDHGVTAKVVRNVSVATSPEPFPITPLKIDAESVCPSTHIVLTGGDILPLHFRGSPFCKAEYRIKDLKNSRSKNNWKKMIEKTIPTAGIYESKELISENMKTEGAIVEYRLTNSKGQIVKANLTGRIKIIDANVFIPMEVTADEITLRTGSSIGNEQMGYDLFLPKGTKLKAVGKIGGEVKLKLSDTLIGWAYEKNLKTLSGESVFSKKILDAVKIWNKGKNSVISLDLNEKVPYRVTVSDDLKSLSLTLFYTISNIDRIRYDTKNENGFLKQIRWFQDSKDTLKIKLDFQKEIWGYDIRFDENKLICEVISPPKLQDEKKSPFSGITIAVDPGHSPETSDGAVSPQGIQEGTVNFSLAEILKEILGKSGAKVVLTREKKEKVELPERGKRAWHAGADIFISLHANALPDGYNPFERHGFSVFYFQPYSLELGKTVHSSFKKSIPLQDDGFYYGNLAVCRTTQMPAILIESAYLIHPEEEELLLDKDFQNLISSSITDGIIQFLKKVN